MDDRWARQLSGIADGPLSFMLAGAVALILIAAACGGPASSAPSPTGSPAAGSIGPSASPERPGPTESTTTEASGALPSIALPSFNPDRDLEALLPATFKGVALEKRSIRDAEVLGQGPTLNTVVSALKLRATDVSVALAEDAAGTLGVTFEAIRFAGADSGRLLQALEMATKDAGDLVGVVHLGGKDVVKANERSGMGTLTYTFVRMDVVFRVTATNDAAADAALAILP